MSMKFLPNERNNASLLSLVFGYHNILSNNSKFNNDKKNCITRSLNYRNNYLKRLQRNYNNKIPKSGFNHQNFFVPNLPIKTKNLFINVNLNQINVILIITYTNEMSKSLVNQSLVPHVMNHNSNHDFSHNANVYSKYNYSKTNNSQLAFTQLHSPNNYLISRTQNTQFDNNYNYCDDMLATSQLSHLAQNSNNLVHSNLYTQSQYSTENSNKMNKYEQFDQSLQTMLKDLYVMTSKEKPNYSRAVTYHLNERLDQNIDIVGKMIMTDYDVNEKKCNYDQFLENTMNDIVNISKSTAYKPTYFDGSISVNNHGDYSKTLKDEDNLQAQLGKKRKNIGPISDVPPKTAKHPDSNESSGYGSGGLPHHKKDAKSVIIKPEPNIQKQQPFVGNVIRGNLNSPKITNSSSRLTNRNQLQASQMRLQHTSICQNHLNTTPNPQLNQIEGQNMPAASTLIQMAESYNNIPIDNLQRLQHIQNLKLQAQNRERAQFQSHYKMNPFNSTTNLGYPSLADIQNNTNCFTPSNQNYITDMYNSRQRENEYKKICQDRLRGFCQNQNVTSHLEQQHARSRVTTGAIPSNMINYENFLALSPQTAGPMYQRMIMARQRDNNVRGVPTESIPSTNYDPDMQRIYNQQMQSYQMAYQQSMSRNSNSNAHSQMNINQQQIRHNQEIRIRQLHYQNSLSRMNGNLYDNGNGSRMPDMNQSEQHYNFMPPQNQRARYYR
ncbi:hypothetical protein A3Q56_05687 [Intoshia linei]|uniref:Uncharacterized protein n=1 Tax=Intoshia linei TaxID=1819745 RepID=A0A177AX33_9BILA|nr:hypothetical protein A3Q56_05687 [Intoshia linei]